jgi:hypothetical protein
MIQNRVIQAFEEEMAQASVPGYQSRYDDLDGDDVIAMPGSFSGSPQIQPAEKPRGPHTAPPRRTQAEPVRGNSFGEGIFE